MPTNEEALAKAKELFAAWGYDLTSYTFDDPYAGARPSLDDYAVNPRRLADEAARFRMLFQASAPAASKYFLFVSAHRRLHRTVTRRADVA